MDELKKLIEAALAEPPKPQATDLGALIQAAISDEPVKLLNPAEVQFNKFIHQIDLQPGTQAVAMETVYERYCNWTRNIMSKTTFYKFLRKMFKNGRSSGILFIYVDPEALGLVPDYTIYKDPYFFRKKKHVKKSKAKQKQHKKQVQAISGQAEGSSE